MNTVPEGIDKIDAKILRVLQKDGRISNLRLAEEVQLSPTAVLERVKRLKRDGYILGFEARLNPDKLGAGMLVFIEVVLDRTTPDVMNAFKAAVQARPEILECHLVAGGFDYLIKTRVADMAAYRGLIASLVWALPGVRETHTYAVMEEVKTTTALALSRRAARAGGLRTADCPSVAAWSAFRRSCSRRNIMLRV
jgi:Lrp/AsnC family leucine-responsive transcriptional regulator